MKKIAVVASAVLMPMGLGMAGAQQTSSVEQNKKGVVMKGFVQDIEDLAIKNDDFRRVLYTTKQCQLVVMALKPKEEIGAEVHKSDQFFRVEEGTGEAVLDGVRTPIRAGSAVVVPAGVNHNIINTGNVPMKLYTLYAPPNHRDGVEKSLFFAMRPSCSGNRCAPGMNAVVAHSIASVENQCGRAIKVPQKVDSSSHSF